MTEFFSDVGRYPFLQRALLAGVLASVACGVIGSYIVVRRVTYVAAGIAHCVLGGIGAALYLRAVMGWTWLDPQVGAAAAALLGAMLIGIVSLRGGQREDSAISAVWSLGMAAGVLFLAITPGYAVDPMTYLFGNILMVSSADLWMLVALDVVIVVAASVFYRQFLAVCFDEEFARLCGVAVERYYLLLLCLTALTIVALVKIVGIVLVIALLSLPAAIAGNFVRTLRQMMIVSIALTLLFTTGGLALSYAPGLPAGATIIALAGGSYLAVAAARLSKRRKRVRYVTQ